MIIAIIDAFYDSNNNHKLCAEVTKITMDDNSKPNDIIQYHLSSMNSLAHLISKIKIVIPVELDSLFISIDKHGLGVGVNDILEQSGYYIIPIEIIGENLIMK